MMPILYKFGPFTVYTYGFFVAVAFLISTSLLTKEAVKKAFDENVIYNFCIILLIAGIVSARLFYVVLNWVDFKDNLLEIAMLQHGGLVWFGGLTGALICGGIYARFKKMAVLKILDLFAPYIALAQSLGRIGCFFNGCCHGKEVVSGVYFPIQLLDSFTLLLIFVILRVIPLLSSLKSGGISLDSTLKCSNGAIFCYYLLFASVQRFVIEFFRSDIRPFFFGLSIFQWISIGIFLLGALILAIISFRRKDKIDYL